jgi:hypothetical protein
MNEKCFGVADKNLPNCECRAIYERLREQERRVPSSVDELPSPTVSQVELNAGGKGMDTSNRSRRRDK